MRIRTLTAFCLLASLIGASAGAADPSHYSRHHRHAPVIRHHRCRTGPRHANADMRHYGYLDGGAPVRERSWGEERSFSEQRSSYDEDGGGVVIARRPWATDRFGYLTWRGKTHFTAPGAEGPEGPESPPMSGPPMPPPSDWRGPDLQGGPPPVEWRGQGCCMGASQQGGYDRSWQGPPAAEGWDGADADAGGAMEVRRF